MSYISTCLSETKDTVLVWERVDPTTRELVEFNASYYFYVSDPKGDRKTIFNTPVKKIDCGRNRAKYYQKKKEFQDLKIQTWESDISPELRVLSNHYYNIPAPVLNITFLDIETDYKPALGFSGPKNPYAPINAISLVHRHKKELISLSVPPKDGKHWTSKLLQQECDKIVPLQSKYTHKFILCADERELLEYYLEEIRDSDILVGWNSEKFDHPYIAKRIELVLGLHRLRELCFIGGAEPRFVEQEEKQKNFGGKVNPNAPKRTYIQLQTSGRIVADYLILYKKYEQSEKPSYNLSSVSDDVLVNENDEPLLPKLQYPGPLHNLYVNDFAFFVRYNIRDTEILDGFEDILGYVDLANQMYHISCGIYEHVPGTLKLAELAIINHCHHVINKVVNNTTEPPEDKSIEGALVLLPKIGMHDWLAAIDIKSLYPSAIMALNISPEKLRGQFLEKERACIAISTHQDIELTFVFESNGSQQTLHVNDWIEFFLKKNWAISGYGTAFDQDELGIIPTVLSNWFSDRKKYQSLKKEAEKNHHHDLELYYDRLQYVFKIKLNSLYGALSNLYFRFYDLRMGESTTGTGRMILRHQCRKVNETLGGRYHVNFPMYNTIEDAEKRHHGPEVALHGPIFKGEFDAEHIIYGDTDSTYFALSCNTLEDAVKTADEVAKSVNASFPEFMKKTFLCRPGYDSRITTTREIVSDRGIFVEKKRYMLHLVDVEGKKVDKCKVMGLDTKKTTLPILVSKKLNKFIELYLKGESWEEISKSIVEYKTDLEYNAHLFDIGLPRGINNIENYTYEYRSNYKTRLPGHVSAAIFYNKMLEEYEDKISLPINSGMKIKVFWLCKPIGRFKSIALPTDAEFVPEWFVDNFKIDRKLHTEKLVDNPLQNILKAVGKRSPTFQSLIVDSEWEF